MKNVQVLTSILGVITAVLFSTAPYQPDARSMPRQLQADTNQLNAIQEAVTSLGFHQPVIDEYEDGSIVHLSSSKGTTPVTIPGDEVIRLFVDTYTDETTARMAFEEQQEYDFEEPLDVGTGGLAFYQNPPQISEAGIYSQMVERHIATNVIGGNPSYMVAELEARFVCGNLIVNLSHERAASQGYDPTRLEAVYQNLDTLVQSLKEPVKSMAKNAAQALLAHGACDQSKRIPIIFLPGVAGSWLTQETSGVDNWLWPIAPDGSRWQLMLDEEGHPPANVPRIYADGILQEFPANFYGDFVAYLEGQGYQVGQDLLLFPYDWRLNNQIHVDELDNMINQLLHTTGQDKVVLIAHSMGGVVARAYLYSGAERAAKVKSLITMGTPYWGAPKVYYGILNGYAFGNDTVRQELMKILIQNWPAAYQLLPTVPFVLDMSSGENTWLNLTDTYQIRYKFFDLVKWRVLYDNYVLSEENDWHMNTMLLEQAAAFHAPVGKKNNPAPFPDGVQQYVIIGYGTRTLGHYVLYDWQPGWIFKGEYLELANGRKVVLEPRFQDGDGTVPLWSLETSTATATYYLSYQQDDPTAHADLPASQRVQALIGSILADHPPDPANFSYDSPDELSDIESGIDFTLRSDASMRIIDPVNGGAMGLNAAGGIDENVPTGTFLQIDGFEYASVANPAVAYPILITGTRAGEFTLTVDIHRGKEVATCTFPQVAVAAGTSAQTAVTPQLVTTECPTLQVNTAGVVSTVPGELSVHEETAVAILSPSMSDNIFPGVSTTQRRLVLVVVAIVVTAVCGLPLLFLGGIVWWYRHRMHPV